MSPVHNNFISWWQLHIFIIGQPHKMLRYLKIVKEAESYLYINGDFGQS